MTKRRDAGRSPPSDTPPDREAVERALEKNPDLLILGGGDGTISGLVDYLATRDIALAVLPFGTANSFARTLELPLDLDGAVATIAGGMRRRVDLGMIDQDYFVNGAAIGLAAMIGETVPHALKRYLGRVGYLLWALRCSIRFRASRSACSARSCAWRSACSARSAAAETRLSAAPPAASAASSAEAATAATRWSASSARRSACAARSSSSAIRRS